MEDNSFLNWLDGWYGKLPEQTLAGLGIVADNTALVSEDMVNGFCHKGNLASREVHDIIAPVVDIFKKSYEFGVRNFLLFQDTHHPQASEFETYPPHCIAGTKESKTIDELASLPFANLFTIFEKNSISSFVGTDFPKWLDGHKSIDTFIVVGDCTDICVYLASIGLKTHADSQNLKRRIIVPASAVATFHTSVEKARELGILPHNAPILHKIFLYHMRLNGIEVVAGLL